MEYIYESPKGQEKKDMKSKLLLHTCCAPCSIAIIEELKNDYNLTVFFYNPNIQPKEEYLKRKKYVMAICEEWKVDMIDQDYEIDRWKGLTVGLEKEPEIVGKRCPICFTMRLEKTAKYAKENNCEYFATSLTSGRNKKADIINTIGSDLEKKYKIKFLKEDWKKGGRQEKIRKMIEERGIYRQNYCGCMHSK